MKHTRGLVCLNRKSSAHTSRAQARCLGWTCVREAMCGTTEPTSDKDKLSRLGTGCVQPFDGP